MLLKFAFLAVFMVGTTMAFTTFMTWNETRKGVPFNDPILNLFLPINISLITSLFTLIPIFFGMVSIFRSPQTSVYFLFSAISICILRTLSIYFVPLEPPVNIIPLTDPVIENLFYGGQVLLKDLFFSGHTANLIVVGLLVEQIWLKKILIFCGIIVGSLLMVQHVHYSIDVFAAPFFAILAYKFGIILGNAVFFKDQFPLVRSGNIWSEFGFK